ncbi:MAG TPA: ABC transporter ATP-binding protein [Gammaproteobacteria bacterium]|nr:ABC transporter ATP-binding protein [Gammaproteobacteria bacterium]
MTDRALSIEGLRKTYSNGFQALDGIDLDVERGDFVALLGPNGAGKSTTIGIICSLITKSAGSVKVFGMDIERQRSRVRRCIGLVPQEFNFNIFEPVEEIVLNQAGYYGIPRREARRRTAAALQRMGLWEKRRGSARELSGGMKRRLMIARALVHEPQLLILDEPTAGVDLEIRRSMWEFLRETNRSGVTIILTTHYLEEAESLCDKVAIIDHGKIVEHGMVSDLIGKLDMETFVLNTSAPLRRAPVLGDYPVRLLDSRTLEVEISRRHSINMLFERLSVQGIQVLSMRNKANRLEELFLRLVDRGGR